MMTGDDRAVAKLLISPSVSIQMKLNAPAWMAAAGLNLMLIGFI